MINHITKFTNLERFFFLLSIVFSIYSCEIHKNTITIIGNIENLPEGKLYLCKQGKEIDSTHTVNGKFVFELDEENNSEPDYIQFVHITNEDSTRRVFIFNSKAKYKSKPLSVDRIMLEENLTELVGGIEDSDYGPKQKSSQFIGRKELGIQSKIFLEDTIMFPTPYTKEHLTRMLNNYPYSYHILFEFKKLVPSMSNKEAFSFLERFDDNLRNGYTGRQIEAYIKSRKEKKMIETSLPDIDDILRKILIPSKQIHLVVLWASWCGPCRREIPDLKKIYQQFKNQNSFDMVSISLDEEQKNWKQALEYEKMPWRQLIMSKEVNMYSKELFSFDGSIPTTLLVDGNGKIIEKYVGYNKESEKEIIELVESYIRLK